MFSIMSISLYEKKSENQRMTSPSCRGGDMEFRPRHSNSGGQVLIIRLPCLGTQTVLRDYRSAAHVLDHELLENMGDPQHPALHCFHRRRLIYVYKPKN